MLSNAAGESWIPGWGAKSYVPCGQKIKTQNWNNIVTNSIKPLKMGNLKKKKEREDSDYIFYLNSKRDKQIAKGREGAGKWQRDLGEMYYLYSTLP